MMLDRRSFVRGLLFAPAVVKSGVLMPVKAIAEPFRFLEIVEAPTPKYPFGAWQPAEPYLVQAMRELEAFYKISTPAYSKYVVPFSQQAEIG